MIVDDVLEIAEKLDVADMPREVNIIQRTLEMSRMKNPLHEIADSLEFIEYLLWGFIRFVKYAAVGGMGLTVVYFILKIYKVF